VNDIYCSIGGFFVDDNIVLRTLAGLVRFEMLGIAAKYDIKSMYFSTATVKNAVWSSLMLLGFRYYSILYVFFLLMLGFRFYSVFICVCFFL